MTARRTSRRPPLIGLRGAFLLDIAVAWYGVALLAWVNPGAPEAGGGFFSDVPTWLYAGLWALAGTLAATCAFQRSPRADRSGFVVAAAFAVARSVQYGWAWLAALLPVGGHGDPQGWFGLLCWAAIAFAITTAAKVHDPGPPAMEVP
jgi:hypothetical protein